jgi:hypothetical protein
MAPASSCISPFDVPYSRQSAQCGLVIYDILFYLHLGSRKIIWLA